MAMSQNEFRANYEEQECRECGKTFNLGAQYYYDDLCPDCKEEKDGEDVVNPVIGTCYVCGDDVRAHEETWSRKAAPYDVRGKVLVCTDHYDHRWEPSRGI